LKKEIHDAIYNHYTELFQNHGKKPASLGWPKGRQDIRFKVMSEIANIKNSKILDVGCSTGELLGRISKNNFELVGIDPDKSAIEVARTNHPEIEFENTDLTNYSTESRFDAFVFRGTFQYLSYDLRSSLSKIKKIGKKDSKIIIYSLPNSDSIIYKILGDKWHMFHKLEHTLIFNRNSFLNLCKIYNFEMVECTYPYLETPYANIEQDYENLIKLIKNEHEKSFPFWGNIMQVVLKIN